MAEESQTEQSRAYFYRNFKYTLEHLARDYQAELQRYSDESWEFPQRAARLSAAVKRYKTYRMLSFIFEIADDIDLDLTPLIVKRLCMRLFGRSGSQDIIVSIFGQKGRQHRSRDNTPAILDEIAARYRLAAHSCQASTLSDIKSVKKNYQAGIRSARNREK
ncbi:cytoplasmic protein [Klebsiella pneumoniae]|uniref:cytoplasmic protein n=1 Tax=Klebsiella pneumoniae TaxID=573 RepID=UPI0024417553|nr:cytoplasmic protein [Klebsiella pneumoniae]